jgi:hypothetical protein
MDPRTGLDDVEKRKFLTPPGSINLTLQFNNNALRTYLQTTLLSSMRRNIKWLNEKIQLIKPLILLLILIHLIKM